MKHFASFALAVLLSLGLMASTNPVIDGSVDLEKSTVNWTGYKVTGKHYGTVNLKSADLSIEGAQIKGSFVIDMTSIATKDISGGGAAKLDGHLKSGDFFGVEKYPEARFEITSSNPGKVDGTVKVRGNLTIKETTAPISFLVSMTEDGDYTVATAEITVDRTTYDVRYGSGKFFDNLGDKAIYDDFDLTVTLYVSK